MGFLTAGFYYFYILIMNIHIISFNYPKIILIN